MSTYPTKLPKTTNRNQSPRALNWGGGQRICETETETVRERQREEEEGGERVRILVRSRKMDN